MLEVKFAERLKELRKENQLSALDIAKYMNVTKATVYRWESGEMEPGYLALMMLAQFYKVSADYLLGLED